VAETSDTAGSGTADAIIDATLRLLADRPLEEVTLRAIAAEAGVSLAVLYAHFATRGHIIAGFSRRIDRTVLAGTFSDMAGESPRDRLFDVLMTRLDALTPHRAAVRALMRAARRDPALAAGLGAIAMRSSAWMLAAAGLTVTGWRGRLALQGLTVAFARVLRTFVDETDPGLPRTMAALDRELRELERRHNRFARIFGGAIREDRPDARGASEPPGTPPPPPGAPPPPPGAPPPPPDMPGAAPPAGPPGAAGPPPAPGVENGGSDVPDGRTSDRFAPRTDDTPDNGKP